MLQARVIPCLLIHKGGLVKTVKFKNPKYVGDPINTVRIFNEKEVDELLVVDIDATVQGRAPDFERIEEIVSEAFMPIGYGGGVSSIDQMRRLYYSGVEKVSLSYAALNNPDLVTEAANNFGSQSVVVTLDIKRKMFGKKYQVVTHNGTRNTDFDPVAIAQTLEEHGAGELLINDVDNDGVMAGYDIGLISMITDAVGIPVIALGGAGSLEHAKSVVEDGGASAAAAGSIFVFHGKHKAVLVNYPTQPELKSLFEDAANE